VPTIMTPAMKKNLFAALFFFSISFCLAYSLLTSDPWDFWNNLVATLIGIAIGIPVGLFVNRRQTEQEEEKRSRIEGEQRKKHVTKIISLLQSELSEGLRGLRRIRDRSRIDTWIEFDPIKVELWQAFSDGGELQWIDDPDLLNTLAAAYHHLSLHNVYQKSLLDVRCNSAFSSDVYKEAITAIHSRIKDRIEESIKVVEAGEQSCGRLIEGGQKEKQPI